MKATFGSGGGTKARVIKGDPFDVPIVQPPLELVIASGHVIKDSETPLAVAPIAVAVRAGAAKPDISTSNSVKRMLLAAKSITYPNVEGSAEGGAAGVSINETLARLGIVEAMRSKTKPSATGFATAKMVAAGEAEIGLVFLSEMIHEPRNHHRRHASAGDFDADGTCGLRIRACKGSRGRHGTARLPLRA